MALVTSVLGAERDKSGAVFVVEAINIGVALLEIHAGLEFKPAHGPVTDVDAGPGNGFLTLLDTSRQRRYFAVIAALAVAQAGTGGDFVSSSPAGAEVEFVKLVVAGSGLLKGGQVMLVAEGETALAGGGIDEIEVAGPAAVVARGKVVVLALKVFDPAAQLRLAGEQPASIKLNAIVRKTVVVLRNGIELAIGVAAVQLFDAQRNGVAGNGAETDAVVEAAGFVITFGQDCLLVGHAGARHAEKSGPAGVKPVVGGETLILDQANVTRPIVVGGVVGIGVERFGTIQRKFARPPGANSPQPLAVVVEGQEIEVVIALVAGVDKTKVADQLLPAKRLVEIKPRRGHGDGVGSPVQTKAGGVNRWRKTEHIVVMHHRYRSAQIDDIALIRHPESGMKKGRGRKCNKDFLT